MADRYAFESGWPERGGQARGDGNSEGDGERNTKIGVNGETTDRPPDV